MIFLSTSNCLLENGFHNRSPLLAVGVNCQWHPGWKRRGTALLECRPQSPLFPFILSPTFGRGVHSTPRCCRRGRPTSEGELENQSLLYFISPLSKPWASSHLPGGIFLPWPRFLAPTQLLQYYHDLARTCCLQLPATSYSLLTCQAKGLEEKLIPKWRLEPMVGADKNTHRLYSTDTWHTDRLNERNPRVECDTPVIFTCLSHDMLTATGISVFCWFPSNCCFSLSKETYDFLSAYKSASPCDQKW